MLPYVPPEHPGLTVERGTPYVSMKCSFPIMAASADRTELQLLDGCWSVLLNVAYPSPRRVGLNRLASSTPGRAKLPIDAPWTYQPPGQPTPSMAISRRFHP